MRRRLALPVLVCAVVASVLAVPSVASAAPAGQPYVRNDRTVPTYSYADAVHESVYVQAPFDSDHDGKRDRIDVDIIRPKTPSGVKVPVIMDASPYFQCCGRGNESETKTYLSDGTIGKLPLFYDNYFVPRGYAVVGVDLTGTSRSTGCGDVGGKDEVRGAKAAIDWLNGRVPGFDADGKRVSADWTSGKVGMIGKSWDGSIANGVAATGVQGLQTIVPISGISSWYDYERFGGVLRSPDYPTFLSGYVGGRPAGVCDAVYAADQAAADDATGNYNVYWAERNYRLHADNVHASVFVVHGINDQNVTTNQFGQWWQRLAANNVPRKIWLSQDGHVDPFDYRRPTWVNTLHAWFDYWLQGLDNGIMDEPQANVERADGHWITQSQWPAAGTRDVSVPLAPLGGSAQRSFTDDPDLSETDATSDPQAAKAGRAVFLSGPLTQPLSMAGSPSVTLRVKVDRPTTELTAKLVDYGKQKRVDYQSRGEGIHTLQTESCWGESTAVDDACYLETAQDYVTTDVDVLTRGWLDAAHHATLSKQTPLKPGKWYSITVPIDTTDAMIAAGHQLGLVLTQSDEENTSPTPTGATVMIDPTMSSLTLPVTGAYSIPAGPTLPTSTATPQLQRTAAPSAPARARVTHELLPTG